MLNRPTTLNQKLLTLANLYCLVKVNLSPDQTKRVRHLKIRYFDLKLNINFLNMASKYDDGRRPLKFAARWQYICNVYYILYLSALICIFINRKCHLSKSNFDYYQTEMRICFYQVCRPISWLIWKIFTNVWSGSRQWELPWTFSMTWQSRQTATQVPCLGHLLIANCCLGWGHK